MNTLIEAPCLSLTQQVLPSPAQIAGGRRRLHRKAALIAVILWGGYAALVFAPVGLLARMALLLVVIGGSVASATGVMHDGNHGSFSRSARVNRLAGASSDVLGASSYLWRFKHNHLHHGNPNVVGEDLDIDQAPFARLAPQQPWRPWHRYQHVYMWVLYGFLTLQWFVLSDFVTLVRGKEGNHPLPVKPRRRDIASILAGKASHAILAFGVPLLFHPWWGVLAFYLVWTWSVGFVLALCFQLAHCVDRAEFFTSEVPRRGIEFERHQLRTTVDIRCRVPVLGRIVSWMMGGLDFQIEHHLLPRLPHTMYRSVAPELEQACASQGIDYRVHVSLTAALVSHERWLRRMGRRPDDGVAPSGALAGSSERG